MYISYPSIADTRERVLQVRLSEREYVELCQRADAVGLPLSSYSRCALFASDAPRRSRVRLPGAASAFFISDGIGVEEVAEAP